MEPGYQNTDCHFFMTASCNKGAACPYRHSESAKKTTMVCTNWRSGFCTAACCYRHPDKRFLGSVKAAPAMGSGPSMPATPADRSKTPCSYYAQGLCKFGAQCQFMHEDVAPVSLHAQARLQEQQRGSAPPAAPPAEKKPQDNSRAQAILSKFSAKANAPQGSVTVRPPPTAAPAKEAPAMAKTTIPTSSGQEGQRKVLLTTSAPPSASSASAASVKVAPTKTPQPSSQPLKRPIPAPVTTANSANGRAGVKSSPPSSKSSSSLDFEVPSFEEILARKKARCEADKKPTATTPQQNKTAALASAPPVPKPSALKPSPAKPSVPARTTSTKPSAAPSAPVAPPAAVKKPAPSAPEPVIPAPVLIPSIQAMKEADELPSYDDEDDDDLGADLKAYQDLLL